MTNSLKIVLTSLCFLIVSLCHAQKPSQNLQKNRQGESMEFDLSCEEEKHDAYILIAGDKYYHGDIAFVCTTPKDVKMSAYLKDGRPLHVKGTVTWEGATIVANTNPNMNESHMADFSRVDVSSSLNDTRSVTARVRNTSITIELISAKATYSELTGQLYGFDDNNVVDAFPYPSHRETEPHGIVWKSIKLGATDRMNYTLEPGFVVSAGRMEFKSGNNITTSPKKPEGEGIVNMTGTAIGESSISINSGGGCRARTATYSEKNRKVGLILVDEPNRLNQYVIDNNLIRITQEDLNRVYNQAVFGWEVEYLGREEIAYDLNNDGVLMTARDNRYSDEQNYIINNSVLAKNKDRYLFFVDNSDLNSQGGGQNEIGNPNGGFIYVDGLVGNVVLPQNTIGHELGHSLSLEHPFHEFIPPWNGDNSNIMQYSGSAVEPIIGDILRKYQWDTIQKN